MIFVDNQNVNDPRINLAIEEYLQRHLTTTDDVLLFYINEPSIIIGRHQNTFEEINQAYVTEHGVHIVRRLSGGGAVYHDLGNLNFSFITTYIEGDFHNFAKFTRPVIAALQGMGVAAELSGRNDIQVEQRKISGNAQYHSGSRLVTHGTLLFDTRIENLVAALNVKATKITSKGIKSVRSRVANISEYLAEPMDILEFRRRILASLFDNRPEIPQYVLQEADWKQINEIAQQRYFTWDWNYGRSPDFNVQKVHRFAFGEVDARINVSRGVIESVRFFGDYQSTDDVDLLESRLTGVRYDSASLEEVLQQVDFNRFFAGLSSQDFIHFLFD
ncbi:MAG: lipoate--protein ligase [Chloroflexi bacterium]|nr:lipoate--protein ligase [Chloroflexota bacterium]